MSIIPGQQIVVQSYKHDGSLHRIWQQSVVLQNGLTAEQVEATVFAHPTLSESIHEAAAGILGEAINFTE
jgi:protein associated with RNAse G/E